MEWAARAIGVFYVVAGLVALRQMVFNWRLEAVFGKIFPTPANERAADIILTLGSVLVLVSGAALVLLTRWAVSAFLACWGLQAGYLLWAQRWYSPESEEIARGRRQTINAFAVYTVATGAVLVFGHIAVLR